MVPKVLAAISSDASSSAGGGNGNRLAAQTDNATPQGEEETSCRCI
jgi:hypothetical protein